MKYTEREVQAPLCCISTTSSLVNKTGSWRFARPVFVDRFSPCNQKCPAGEDIAGYMYLAGQGRFEDAWRLIMKENPFPAVMGRVCYHACEKTCNRNEHDEPVAIHTVERFIGEYALAHNLKVELDRPEIDRKIAIVGAGPAGLSAAYHLRLIGYSATVFDSKELPGGLMRYGIPSYRLPEDILDGEISRLSDIGIEFKMGVKVGSDVNWETINNGFDAFLVAIGAYQETELNLRGLDKKGVYHALEFLKEVNLRKWPIIGKRTVVIGGGNSALDCARVARRLGAEVSTVYRRSETEMPAQPEEVEMAREEGVRFVFLSSPVEISGQEKVTGIKLAKMKLGETDSSGRRSPIPTGETFDMDCETLILAIGESCIVEDLPSFLQTERKVVDTDDLGRTSASKCFAGGDIIDIPHTVTHAIGSGKRAVVAIDRYLMGIEDGEEAAEPFKWGETGNFCLAGLDGRSLFPRRNPMSEVVAYGDLNPFYFDHRSRTTRHVLPAKERIKSFEEVVSSPTEEEALWEAKRCFNCGSCTDCGNCFIFCPDCSIRKDADGHGYLVDLDYCKGCGICVQECPRGAMKMELME